MERQSKFTNESPERIDATRLEDGNDAYFHLASPNLKSVEAARKAVEEATVTTDRIVLKEVIPQPHEHSRRYGRSIGELRARKLGHVSSQPTRSENSWNDFEVTR